MKDIKLKSVINRVVGFVLFTAIFFSCANRSEWANRIEWNELEFEKLPTSKDYPNDGAIILSDIGTMEIFGEGELSFSIFERHRIVKILNSSGHKFANVAIPYGSHSNVQNIEARTISPKGKITVIKPNDVYDINLYPNFVFYSDQRAKLFTFPAVENGCIVEYKYALKINSRTFGNSWIFQDEAPTLLSRFTLSTPGELDVDYRIYNIELEPFIKSAPDGFHSTHRWEVKNVPPLATEIAMPVTKDVSSRLALSPVGIKSWKDVTDWYYKLIKPQLQPGENIKELVTRLTEGNSSDEEKLRKIYEWVRDQVRYIAVEIGIGGFRPHRAEEVIVNKYGDCKDMTTLLCSIAGEAGIEVHEVLISTRNNARLDTSLASTSPFNHAIAYCPSLGDSGIWMDATDKGCPFGQLPWYDQGVQVLIISEESDGTLITTPKVDAKENRSLIDWQVELLSTGAANVKGKTILWRAQANEMRQDLYYASPDEKRQWLERYLATLCSGADLDSFTISGFDLVKDPLKIEYKFSTKTFAKPINDNKLIFNPGSIAGLSLPDFFRSPKRVHPIRLNFGLQRELNLSIQLPEGWMAEIPEMADSLNAPFGSAFWKWNSDNNTFRIQSTHCILGEEIDPSDYHKFQKFLDGIREKDLRDVMFKQ